MVKLLNTILRINILQAALFMVKQKQAEIYMYMFHYRQKLSLLQPMNLIQKNGLIAG